MDGGARRSTFHFAVRDAVEVVECVGVGIRSARLAVAVDVPQYSDCSFKNFYYNLDLCLIFHKPSICDLYNFEFIAQAMLIVNDLNIFLFFSKIRIFLMMH